MNKLSNQHLITLVRLLNDLAFHDGPTLAGALHVSRNAVWKAIQKLKEKGINIETNKSLGYRLCAPLVLLDEKIIRRFLPKSLKLTVLESVDSTNQFLLESQMGKRTQIVLAEEQTAGKGRLGRQWHSPFGKNLYMSCHLMMEKDLSELGGLSLIISLSILEMLMHFMKDAPLHVKWPNDVLCQHKKIAGTLIEVKAESHGRCHVVIGIGLNVNSAPNGIAETTSMSEVSGEVFDRHQVFAVLYEKITKNLQRFEMEGFAGFQKAWRQHDYLLEKHIGLNLSQDTVFGKVLGVDLDGRLRMLLDDDRIQVFATGEASVLKNKTSLK